MQDMKSRFEVRERMEPSRAIARVCTGVTARWLATLILLGSVACDDGEASGPSDSKPDGGANSPSDSKQDGGSSGPSDSKPDDEASGPPEGKPDDEASGPSEGKPLEELSESELRSFCESALREEQEVTSVEQYCEIDAVLYAANSDECQVILDGCVEEEEPFWDSDYQDGIDACQELEAGDLFKGCEVAVRELRRCYQAINAETARLAREWSCEEPGQQEPNLPSACTSVFEECPELSPDDDMTVSIKQAALARRR